MKLKTRIRSAICRWRKHRKYQLNVLEALSKPMVMEFTAPPGSAAPSFGTVSALAKFHCPHCGTVGVGPITQIVSHELARRIIKQQELQEGGGSNE